MTSLLNCYSLHAAVMWPKNTSKMFFCCCCFFVFFQSRLIILTKLQHVSYFSNLTVCLLLFQISCGGKSCALFWTGEVLNDESSFDLTNKKNNSERLHTGILCRNTAGSESVSLCTSPGLPGQTKMSE